MGPRTFATVQEFLSHQLCSGANEDHLQKDLCHTQVCCTQSPCPCSRPVLTRTSIGDTQTEFRVSLCGLGLRFVPFPGLSSSGDQVLGARTLVSSASDPAVGHRQLTPPLETPRHPQASLAQSLVGSLLLSPGSWCTQGFVPSKSLFPQSCASSGGSLVGLMATSSKRAFAIPRSTAPRAPVPAAAHRSPRHPPETPGRSQASLGQSLVRPLLLSPGFWCTHGFVRALQESVSPVLCKFCNQIPLASKVKFPGGSQSLCQIPKLGNLFWVLELS